LARAGVLIAAVFAVNMLTWDGDYWFQWPTLAILLMIALRVVGLLPRGHRDGGG
jgi:hypothetical protein